MKDRDIKKGATGRSLFGSVCGSWGEREEGAISKKGKRKKGKKREGKGELTLRSEDITSLEIMVEGNYISYQ